MKAKPFDFPTKEIRYENKTYMIYPESPTPQVLACLYVYTGIVEGIAIVLYSDFALEAEEFSQHYLPVKDWIQQDPGFVSKAALLYATPI